MKILAKFRRCVLFLALSTPLWAQAPQAPLPKAEFVKYATVRLTSDLSHLNPNQKMAVKEMIAAARIMDGLFWRQSYGDPEALKTLVEDPEVWEYARINYGPWDRLQGNRPFLEGFGDKPKGAGFYPADMTKKEFEDAPDFPGKNGQYTLIRRRSDGTLTAIPFSEAYRPELEAAAVHLRRAAQLVEDEGLKTYLTLRAEALLSNEYQPSDMAWMDMKTNPLDLVIGPIENYEDKLYGTRSAFEGYVLIKDMEWSKKLSRYAKFLPELQRELPVPEAYKAEQPGSNSELNAYDVVYYSGDCNAGSKTIAINLPNDEEVQLKKGSRRLQLKNAMRAKYDQILIPIANKLIVPQQRPNITFDAFFANTMFHEVAHGLGIKKLIDGSGNSRDALKEIAGSLEEGKADLLGLFMIEGLTRRGELPEENLENHYITFLAGIFRSVRFGASSAHGVANLVRFNYFKEQGAFRRNEQGLYEVDVPKMAAATEKLTSITLKFQGDGDYQGAKAFLDTYGKIDAQLQADLDSLKEIPTDIIFEQGEAYLGL